MEEREHVNILLRRMQNYLIREAKKTSVDPFRPLLAGENDLLLTLATGQSCRFLLEAGRRTSARRIPEGWKISIGPKIDRRALHRFLWKLLCEHQQGAIEELIREINTRTLQVRIQDVRLRYAVSQWGSCSSIGRISLNPALLFLPQELLEYVCIHELAHRLHRGHTKRYWREVERAFPAYRHVRTQLRSIRLRSL